MNDEKSYFQYFIDLFVTPKWLNDYAHKYKIEKLIVIGKSRYLLKLI